jgi:hypothetical protein
MKEFWNAFRARIKLFLRGNPMPNPDDDEPVRSANILATWLKHGGLAEVANNPAALDEKTAEIVKEWPQPAFIADKIVYRKIVDGLIAIAIITVVGGMVLPVAYNKEMSAGLIAVGSACVGALASAFTLSRK